jgi:hypothetical protein
VLGLITASAVGPTTIELNAEGRTVLQSWIDNPLANYGFVIQNYTSADDALGFRSSESATAPILSISYLPASGGGNSMATTGEGKRPAKSELKSRALSVALDLNVNGTPTTVVTHSREVRREIALHRNLAAGDTRIDKAPTSHAVGIEQSLAGGNWAALRLGRAALVDELFASEETQFGKRSLLFSK